MSDGMSDASAEDRLYRGLWNAVYDLREVLGAKFRVSRWPANLVSGVNELISDLTTYHGIRYVEEGHGR